MYYNTVNSVIAIIVDAKTLNWRLRVMLTTKSDVDTQSPRATSAAITICLAFHHIITAAAEVAIHPIHLLP